MNPEPGSTGEARELLSHALTEVKELEAEPAAVPAAGKHGRCWGRGLPWELISEAESECSRQKKRDFF